MSEIVKKWIMNCIGVVMNMAPDAFAAEVMDGTIAAQILHNYNIINEDQRLKVISTENINTAFNNWMHLSLWLKTINVNCSENDIIDITNGKCSTSLNIFYQMYLAIQDKDELYYTARKRGNERLRPTDTRFDIVKVNEITDADFEVLKDSPYSEQLVANRGVIEWNRSRYEILSKSYEEMRERYAKYLEQKLGDKQQEKHTPIKTATVIQTNLENLHDDTVIEDCSYEELIENRDKAKKRSKFEPDPKVASDIVKSIKVRRKEEKKAKEYKVQQQRLLLMELWNKILTEQEKELDERISAKILKQSVFEKQMCAKMFEVRQQKDNIMRNRKFVEDEVLKKREEEFLENVFSRDTAVGDQKYNYYFEKSRTLELHKRIYAERHRLKTVRKKKLISGILDDCVDLALKYHWYKKKYSTEPDWRTLRQWGNLFIKSKSIFNYIEDLSEIALNVEVPEEMEEILCIEIDRQDALDQRDFENYLNFEWPWKLDDLLTNYQDNLVLVELGMNVVGHDVHKVLYAKYPRPEEPSKPDIPSVNVAACINGLPNTNLLPVLQKLLKNRQVRVIEMQDAINCCLNAFNEESRVEKIDTALVQQTEATKKVLNKKEKPKPLQKGSKSKKNFFQPSHANVTSKKETATQTPLIYPCEEANFSKKGELGQMAYNLLNLGEQLTDNLVVAMFVEYLKTFKKINGWVLINFPTTLAQASVLEEALNGCEIPDISHTLKNESSMSIGDIADLNFRNTQMDLATKNSILRKSALVPNPVTILDKPIYKTYLTAYIKIQRENDFAEENLEKNIESYLDNFYLEQGCCYFLQYKEFRFAEIKRLAKSILGEYSITPKPSLELFGDTILFLESTLGVAKKEAKPKIETSSMNHLRESESSVAEIPSVSFREPKAGEMYWHYNELFIPNHVEIAMATFWETLELIYINDFKQLFFLKRIAYDAIVPYLSYVKSHLASYIARPDNKQNYLHDFQKYYNEISADMRDDAEIKAEIHCTIAEFREKLWEICDTRMQESEIERQNVISDDWLPNQAIEIINNSISMMQLELDRCCDSFQFINDYYSGAITKLPAKEVPLQKVVLSRISAVNGPGSSVYNQLKSVASSILTNMEPFVTNTPFHTAIERTHDTAQAALSKYRTTVNAAATNAESYFKPKPQKKPPKKPDKKKGKAPPSTDTEPNDGLKAAAPKLFQEWQCSLLGEYQRARMRITMIKEIGLQDVNTILSSCQNSFHNLFDEIRERYQSEIDSVNTACEVLANAVEAEIPIQPQLVLDGGKFYVEPDVLLFPDPPEKPQPPIVEHKLEDVFTIKQLEILSNIFMHLVPQRTIPERAFVYILQDLVVQNAEDGQEPMIPVLWQKLSSHQVEEFSTLLFGNAELIDWKDFIIYNLEIPYPTTEQLIEIRSNFMEKDPDSTELITDYQFFSIRLWFEDYFNDQDPQELFRSTLIKKLLFNLYKIDDATLNYTAFLLDFCKCERAVDGFVKALSLAFGKKVCDDEVIGEMYVSNIKEQRFLDEQARLIKQLEYEEAVKCAQSVLSSLISTTVHECESVIIESYHSICSETETQEEETHTYETIEQSTEEYQNVYEESALEFTDIYSCEMETESFTKSEEFSNVEIDFQPEYNKNYIYLLKFEWIVAILSVSSPYHAKSQTFRGKSFRECLEEIYDRIKDPTFNDQILVHVLVNDKIFNHLLSQFLKFVIKSPKDIVQMLVEND